MTLPTIYIYLCDTDDFYQMIEDFQTMKEIFGKVNEHLFLLM